MPDANSPAQNTPSQWTEAPAGDVADAVVGAMTAGGVDHLFFTSGSEIGFYQEATSKAKAQGRKTLNLITVPLEHVSLNAALGFAAVSGRPAATAAHVDCGTQHYGGAVHTAWRSGLPVIITAGAPPTAYPGSIRGARNGAHLWSQQQWDQNSIIRQYVKWDKRLEYQDNPGLMMSRAIQVATSEPAGPVYMSFPQEIALMPLNGTRYPTVAQLGVARPASPDPEAIKEVVDHLLKAKNPMVVALAAGRNDKAVPALVELCELAGIPVVASGHGGYLSFPMTHPLYQRSGMLLREADMVITFEAEVPWLPGMNEPPGSAYIAAIDHDPIRGRIPSYDFSANMRITADPLMGIKALTAELKSRMTDADKKNAADRKERWAKHSKEAWAKLEADAKSRSTKTPIDPLWVSYQLGQVLDDNCILFDETLATPRLRDFVHISKPRSYFKQNGSSGGWSPGAALGAKFAAPDRDIVAACGDGFYMFGTPGPALWAAAHYKKPFMAVVYVNRSYSTGTLAVSDKYPDSFAQKAGYPGGYFDPPIDFAKEAEACGAYGENVRDPAEVGPALKRGLEQIRNGKPAVVAVWLPRLGQKD
jgi:acetolactate synthase-1/2/3 large subunit